MNTTSTGRRCSLYRHYDEHDVLLYVGITEAVSTRTKAHAHRSDWTRYAVRFTGQWFPDRVAAEAAEQIAIETENPVFNRCHAEGDPWARIEQYLADRQSGVGRSGRRRERLVTLSEAAREQHAVNLSLRYLWRCRRDPMGKFPRPAGREWFFWKLYSEDEIQDWTESGGPEITFWTRVERADHRAFQRRDSRQRSRGEPTDVSERRGPVLPCIPPNFDQPWLTLLEATRDGLVGGPYQEIFQAAQPRRAVDLRAGVKELERARIADGSFPTPTAWSGPTPVFHPAALARWESQRVLAEGDDR